jgi:hypothetical protein
VVELLLPRTDGGVAVQFVIVTAVFATAMWLMRRKPDARLLVIGLWLTAYGVMGVRALH